MVLPEPSPVPRRSRVGTALAGTAAGLSAAWLAAGEPALVGGRPALGVAAALVAGGGALAAVGAFGVLWPFGRRGRPPRRRDVALLVVGAALAVGAVAGWTWRLTRPRYEAAEAPPARRDPASNGSLKLTGRPVEIRPLASLGAMEDLPARSAPAT